MLANILLKGSFGLNIWKLDKDLEGDREQPQGKPQWFPMVRLTYVSSDNHKSEDTG